jgi:glutaminyl-tRNA synthetase
LGDKEKDFKDLFNPNSLEILSNCQIEPSLAKVKAGEKFQFERQGYFCVDILSTEKPIIFNRIVPLRDSWAKIEKKQ